MSDEAAQRRVERGGGWLADAASGAALGGLVGLLLGLSASEAVGGAVAALTALPGAFFGVAEGGIGPLGGSARPARPARLIGFCAPCAAGVLAGVHLRATEALAPAPRDQLAQWTGLCMTETEARALVVSQRLGLAPMGHAPAEGGLRRRAAPRSDPRSAPARDDRRRRAGVPVSARAAAPPEVNAPLKAIGHYLGVHSMDNKPLRATFGATRLSQMLPDGLREELRRSRAIDLDFDVVRMDGHLLPGLSGAPIVTAAGDAAAVGSGGLQGGAASVSLGAPARCAAAGSTSRARASGVSASWPSRPTIRRASPTCSARRGFHGATLALRAAEATARILVEALGYAETARETDRDGETLIRLRARAGAGDVAGVVDLAVDPAAPAGRSGRGTVHHVAFSAPDRAAQLRVRARLAALGLAATEPIDRTCFTAIYARTPGGVLFEVATDGPGFEVDEPRETLGEALVLPPWREPMRARIMAVLPPLDRGGRAGGPRSALAFSHRNG